METPALPTYLILLCTLEFIVFDTTTARKSCNSMSNVIIAIARPHPRAPGWGEKQCLYWSGQPPTRRYDIHTLRINCYAVTSKAKVRSARVIQFVPHPMKKEIYLHKTRCRQGSKSTFKKLQCQNLHLEFAAVRLIR